MPREAKFSPPFHEVRPEMVPPHSFCQIRLPIRWASAGEISIAACNATLVRAIITRITVPRPAVGYLFSEVFDLKSKSDRSPRSGFCDEIILRRLCNDPV